MNVNYYLYNCNLNHDIENNIGEIKIPEFTMEHIIAIDENYKKYFEQLGQFDYQYQNSSVDQQVVQMLNELEINELYMEHVNNINILVIRMNEYNTIHHTLISKRKLTVEEKMQEYMFIRSKQIQKYFGDILPIIQKDKDNLIQIMNISEIKYSNTL